MSAYEDLRFAPMFITDVFESMKASTAWYDKTKLRQGEGVLPFVSRTKTSNGTGGFTARQDKSPEVGNAITIGLDTQTITYQPVPFYTSQNIQVLRHPSLDEHNALMLASCLREQMGKFSWGGNGATLGRLKATRIMVPVTTENSGGQVVDWEGMTRFGEELRSHTVTRARNARTSGDLDADTDLPDLRFEPMLITDVLTPHKGKRLVSAARKLGNTPFVGGSESYNSVTGFSKVDPLFPGGWLTLTYNGSVGHCRLQPAPFFASDDVIALEPPEGVSHEALLLCASIITRECVAKYSYGAKLNLARLVRQTAMLPVTTNDSSEQVVDWEGMTLYGQIIRARVERAMTQALA
ncbi:restriction endonuclease subunit S [Acaricomes phytoseiuli]|uniref:restriction endonuclease subunit S n=1 Tax=Acaricomes phytoseiuli TaxID=291968 RepID=UPI00037E6DB2|nr:restriction endonuclease subunit S [Acaricomes phytoseiuli]